MRIPFLSKKYYIFVPRRGGRLYIGEVKAKSPSEAWVKSKDLLQKALQQYSDIQCYRHIIVFDGENEEVFPNPFFTEDEEICARKPRRSKGEDTNIDQAIQKVLMASMAESMAKIAEMTGEASAAMLAGVLKGLSKYTEKLGDILGAKLFGETSAPQQSNPLEVLRTIVEVVSNWDKIKKNAKEILKMYKEAQGLAQATSEEKEGGGENGSNEQA